MADVDQETIVQTQATLAKVIKKPVLTDKLLRRPPFKFLHDIIVNVSLPLPTPRTPVPLSGRLSLPSIVAERK